MNDLPGNRDPADRGWLPLIAAMLHTRIELLSLDVEAHVGAALSSLGMAVAAFVLALVAFVFAGVAVIAVFWDSHRILASVGTTLAYVLIAVVFVLRARHRWRTQIGRAHV